MVKSQQLNLKQFGNFSNYNISNDGGLLLLDKIESKCNLIKTASKLLTDPRNPDLITHSVESMLKQLVYGVCMGYSDLNDHDTIRKDMLYKTVLNKKEDLASDSTLSRLQGAATHKSTVDLNKLLVEEFISSFNSEPKELILDVDWTDIELHGDQADRHYHGYYKEYCYLPLQITCGDELLINYLRPSNIDGFKHTWPIMGLLIKRLKKSFPNTKIIVRADSGFCRHSFLGWLELYDVEYIMGLAQNKRLLSKINQEISQIEELYNNDNNKTISKYKYFKYAAHSWKKERCVISKIEKNYHGPNIRFVVTNINSTRAKALYRELYCKRGDAENKIKSVQLDLFGDRMSSSAYQANSLRLMISSLSYILIHKLKSKYLKYTNLAKATAGSIRLKILKIAVLIKVRKTSIRFEFSANYHYKKLFTTLLPKLFTG